MTETPLTRGEQTAQEILKAAYDLFTQQGYHGTSMRQIAHNAGIALGGIYNHFSSKEEVFKHVFVTYHPVHDFFPKMMIDAETSLEILVKHAIENVKISLDRRPEFLNLFFIEVVEFNTAHIMEMFSQYYPTGLRMIRSLQQRDDRIRDIPPIVMARSIIGMIFTYYITERLMSGIVPAELRENSAQQFADVLLYGLVSGGKPPEPQDGGIERGR